MLRPGEILRSINIPGAALRKRYAHRRFALTKLGRSTVFLVGTQSRDRADLLLTVTAGTTHPLQLHFDGVPDAGTLPERIEAIWTRTL